MPLSAGPSLQQCSAQEGWVSFYTCLDIYISIYLHIDPRREGTHRRRATFHRCQVRGRGSSCGRVWCVSCRVVCCVVLVVCLCV